MDIMKILNIGNDIYVYKYNIVDRFIFINSTHILQCIFIDQSTSYCIALNDIIAV